MKDSEKLCAWENYLRDPQGLPHENSLWEDTGLFCKIYVRKKKQCRKDKKMKSLEISRVEQNEFLSYVGDSK